MKYRNKDWLYEKYHDDGMTQDEIADLCGVSQRTIGNWMRRHNIETRSQSEALANRYPCPNIYVDSEGYQCFCSHLDGKKNIVRHHQLLAIANGEDPHKVFSDGDYHVHHKNGHRLDNRTENLELLTASEHMKEHKAYIDEQRTVGYTDD